MRREEISFTNMRGVSQPGSTGLKLFHSVDLQADNPIITFREDYCVWPTTIGLTEAFSPVWVVCNQGTTGQGMVAVKTGDATGVVIGKANMEADLCYELKYQNPQTITDLLTSWGLPVPAAGSTLPLTFWAGYLTSDTQGVVTDQWNVSTVISGGGNGGNGNGDGDGDEATEFPWDTLKKVAIYGGVALVGVMVLQNVVMPMVQQGIRKSKE